MKTKILASVLGGLLLAVCSVSAAPYKYVVFTTNLGDIKLKVYTDTPLHAENFLKLAKAGHYNGLLFHRVIKDFMIQGGSSDSRNAEKGAILGSGGIDYTIQAEINPLHFHKKGALAAARQGDAVNPEKRSSGEQFYIVQGTVLEEKELDRMEQQRLMQAKTQYGKELFQPRESEYRELLRSGNREAADELIRLTDAEIAEKFDGYNAHKFSPEARAMYITVGGTPFLDGEYTVFGEVVEGLDIVDKIAAQETDGNNRPLEDIVILETRLKRK